MRDIDRYGDVVQTLVDVGISEISNVESDVSNYRALREQALTMALRDARERAGFLAREMGVSLGSVRQIGRQQTHWRVGDLVPFQFNSDRLTCHKPGAVWSGPCRHQTSS